MCMTECPHLYHSRTPSYMRREVADEAEPDVAAHVLLVVCSKICEGAVMRQDDTLSIGLQILNLNDLVV
jgi:hypothetical protein